MDINRDQGKEPVEQEAPQRPQKRGGGRKPWKLEYRTRMQIAGPGWHRSGTAYKTEKHVRQAFEAHRKKEMNSSPRHSWDWRIIDPDGNVVETFIAKKEQDNGS